MTNNGSKKILFICGSMNQTTMMHQISKHLKHYDCRYTPYYADGFLSLLVDKGYLDWTILGGEFRANTENYLLENNLKIDYYGSDNDYDLVLTCSDLIVPENIRNKKLLLVQEGMTNPKKLGFYLVKYLKLPSYIGDTATTGLSDKYDVFCVASPGYANFFAENGVRREKLRITGIPNYDNCESYNHNDFPHSNFVLAATSDSRETFIYENRKKFIQKVVEIAKGRQIIFKLHPNEWVERAVSEINKWAPEALVYAKGNVHEMIANCEVLVTRYSTVVYTGIALGKEVYSEFDLELLRRLAPLQNGGASSWNIAQECEKLIKSKIEKVQIQRLFKYFPKFKMLHKVS